MKNSIKFNQNNENYAENVQEMMLCSVNARLIQIFLVGKNQ